MRVIMLKSTSGTWETVESPTAATGVAAYAVGPYPDVKDEIAALSQAACVGYREAVEVMGLVPWNGAPYNPESSSESLVIWLTRP